MLAPRKVKGAGAQADIASFTTWAPEQSWLETHSLHMTIASLVPGSGGEGLGLGEGIAYASSSDQALAGRLCVADCSGVHLLTLVPSSFKPTNPSIKCNISVVSNANFANYKTLTDAIERGRSLPANTGTPNANISQQTYQNTTPKAQT